MYETLKNRIAALEEEEVHEEEEEKRFGESSTTAFVTEANAESSGGSAELRLGDGGKRHSCKVH